MNIEEIKRRFISEFGATSNGFDIIDLCVEEAVSTVNPKCNRPGVYVYWHPEYDVVLVGKSQSNSKKRALQHIKDNSGNNVVSMNYFEGDSRLRILLFNISEDNFKHWVLALEAFFEWNIRPVIKAWRIG